MAMKIELDPMTASLTIGDDYVEENEIRFKITLKGNEPVWLYLEIPIGDKGVLRHVEDMNDLKVATPGIDPSPKIVSETGSMDSIKWSLGDIGEGVQLSNSTELTVSISKIRCRASEGVSELVITGVIDSGDEFKEKIKVEKLKPTQPVNPILYFIAEPTFLTGSGEVKLMWEVLDDKSVSLELLDGVKRVKPKSPVTTTIAKTGTYTLRAGNVSHQVTVNVLDEGWKKLYPLKDKYPKKKSYPSVIFDASGQDNDALYSIFVLNKEDSRKAVLCKSTNGINDWHIINEAVPVGMESSPGVRLGNRLWLLGGSAVDPENISNRICFYDLARPNKGWRDANVEGFEDGARMGHACVSVDDSTILVMGGLDEYGLALNDSWKLSIDNEHETVKAKMLNNSCDWPPRCMFSAINFYNMIWVCGGVSSPNGSPLGDMWAISRNNIGNECDVNWEARPGKSDSVAKGAIGIGLAATENVLYSVVLSNEDRLETKMDAIGSKGITQKEDAWSSVDINKLDFGHNLPNTPVSLSMVYHNNRLYLRNLYRNDMYGEIEAKPLYVYIKNK